jgi:hypothetical protein
MNNQKNSSKDLDMSKATNNASGAVGATSAMSATNAKAQDQSLTAKQQASKAEYGTLTAKDDANNDYE